MQRNRLIGVIADVHGEYRLLQDALRIFRRDGVTAVAILGDLFDRIDQADRCAQLLAQWEIIGVFGNHEHEAFASARNSAAHDLDTTTIEVLRQFRTSSIERYGARFTHDLLDEQRVSPLDRMMNREPFVMSEPGHRLTFYGHTHHRLLRNEHGTIELTRQSVRLNGAKRYYINPGPLADGQFLIWDRDIDTLEFSQL